MLDLESAIKHAEEVADNLEQEAECIRSWGKENDTKHGAINCEKCAEEHRQLAEWLTDYKRLKEQKSCEMTAEEYRQRMIQAFHNADTDELIAVCVLPTEKEFEHLEWLLKNHYKQEPSYDDAIRREDVLEALCKAVHKNDDTIPCSNQRESCLWSKTKVQDYAREIWKLPPVTPQPKYEDIAKAFQLGLAFGFGEKYEEIDKVIDEIKKVCTPQQKIWYCKNCRWWKDSDGVYRRGVGAESQCPINLKEVYEGNGYCFMYEPQESEG